ncbi:MAG: hypothetical protein PHQ23_08990 [Candidatus Wallbacteria bacterium]|nr:hypothetical protein [Candidatus Wallbacteria bacterium]
MRTRNASLAEKYGIRFTIALLAILSLTCAYLIFRNYNVRISEVKAKKEQLKEQENRNLSELGKLKNEISILENQVKDKQKRIEFEQNLYSEKKKELDRYVGQIPPLYMKSMLRRNLVDRAMQLNVDVLAFSARELDMSKFIGLQFFPLQFTMELVGEYGSIKNYLWYLDRNIILPDVIDPAKKWSFIVQVSQDQGLEIISPGGTPQDVGMGPRPPNMPGPPPGMGGSGAEQQTVEATASSVILRDMMKKKGLLDNGKLKVRLKLVTFIRRTGDAGI